MSKKPLIIRKWLTPASRQAEAGAHVVAEISESDAMFTISDGRQTVRFSQWYETKAQAIRAKRHYEALQTELAKVISHLEDEIIPELPTKKDNWL